MTNPAASSADIPDLSIRGGGSLAGRFAPVTLRTACSILFSLITAKRSLPPEGPKARIAPPFDLPWSARRGVNTVLCRTLADAAGYRELTRIEPT